MLAAPEVALFKSSSPEISEPATDSASATKIWVTVTIVSLVVLVASPLLGMKLKDGFAVGLFEIVGELGAELTVG